MAVASSKLQKPISHARIFIRVKFGANYMSISLYKPILGVRGEKKWELSKVKTNDRTKRNVCFPRISFLLFQKHI